MDFTPSQEDFEKFDFIKKGEDWHEMYVYTKNQSLQYWTKSGTFYYGDYPVYPKSLRDIQLIIQLITK